jgi:DNA primase
MATITQSSIRDEIKSINIVDIVSDYIEVKKSGGNFKANCPFHGEKTPSFVISPSKQISHCFGCGCTHDSISFVMEFNKLNFVEAVEKIASDFGVNLVYEEGSEDYKKREEFFSVNDSYSHFIVKNLREKDREYLHGRGMTDETIEEWGLGFSSRGADDVIDYFASNFVPIPNVVESGVLGEVDGRLYNPFSSRIIFPIRNVGGKIIGFAGRSLAPDAKQKYKNTRDTLLFSKSRVLFGFDKAREVAAKKRWLIVEEGQFDVMLTRQVGIKNVCGTQGSALTLEHIKLIKRIGVKVLLATDGDKAGIASAVRASILLSQQGIDGGVALFGEGDDPADMVASGKVDEFKAILKRGTKRKLVSFVIEQIASETNMGDAFAKKAGVERANEFLNSLDAIIAGEYRAVVARLFGIGENLVGISGRCSIVEEQVAIPTATLEDNVLFTLHQEPWYLDEARDIIEPKSFKKQFLLTSLLSNEEIEEGGLSLLSGIVLLSEKELFRALREISKRYIRNLLSNTSDMKSAMALTKRLSLL